MTVQELIDKLSALPTEYKELPIKYRAVLTNYNVDCDIESARPDIAGGPVKAYEYMAVILR